MSDLLTKLKVLQSAIASWHSQVDDLVSIASNSQTNVSQDGELKEDIKRLFRWCNDLSELRHETNQNEGCTRAKVENDLMPAVADLSFKLNTMQSDLREFEKQKVEPIDKELKSVRFTHQMLIEKCLERLDKLESRVNKGLPESLGNIALKKLPLDQCTHDWDYSQILTSNPPKIKCKKCREFKALDLGSGSTTLDTNDCLSEHYSKL